MSTEPTPPRPTEGQGDFSRWFQRGIMALEAIALELHDLVLLKNAERDERLKRREARRRRR